MVLPHFDVLCDLLLYRPTTTCLFDLIINKRKQWWVINASASKRSWPQTNQNACIFQHFMDWNGDNLVQLPDISNYFFGHKTEGGRERERRFNFYNVIGGTVFFYRLIFIIFTHPFIKTKLKNYTATKCFDNKYKKEHTRVAMKFFLRRRG